MHSLTTELRYWREVEGQTGCTIFLRPGTYLPSLTVGVPGKYSIELWLLTPNDCYSMARRIASVNIGQQPEQIIGDNIGELLQCVVPWLENRPELIPPSSPLGIASAMAAAKLESSEGEHHGTL